MFENFDEKINGFLFVIIFPFLLFFISYYGFETSYVVGIKSWEKAPDFMFSSVYAYRVIPNFLSVHVTEIVTDIVNNYLPFAKNFILKSGSYFYHSTFLTNVFFFILTSVVLNRILKLKPVELLLNPNIRRMVHLIAVFFIVMLQYVPTNCDCIALFFYIWGVFFTLKYLEDRKSADLISLGVIIFISTFIRETACLNIAFFAAVFIDFENLKKKNFIFIKELMFLIVAFILPYIGLRMMIHQDASFFEGIYLVKNFTSPYNMMGLLFGILSIYFSYQFSDEVGKMMVKKYLFFSIPYLIMITLVGLFWETRLFMPLIVTGIVMASYQFKNIISNR
ncbi:hypothetical protein QFZ37_000914 [Chryseobacterium ginsenosidimutans]|uniref:hypothetical protein n=1 Tax=Chryseobacterium ginsenosidimutans TaxID=687846 RepID=UPI00277D3342|nr:hypothetical protein [Chryseobacterium ginsenosidimutans]MDQ0592545.1 hypothetical protein [Chryseobacterium ginsenosidimutans]